MHTTYLLTLCVSFAMFMKEVETNQGFPFLGEVQLRRMGTMARLVILTLFVCSIAAVFSGCPKCKCSGDRHCPDGPNQPNLVQAPSSACQPSGINCVGCPKISYTWGTRQDCVKKDAVTLCNDCEDECKECRTWVFSGFNCASIDFEEEPDKPCHWYTCEYSLTSTS